PLGSKVRQLSGDHYMLVGDAASLIDPMTGEGIGNAIYSGYIAAEQARDCLAKADFSQQFLRAYDQRVYRVMGKEFKISHTFQRLLRVPALFNFIANRTVNNKQIQDVLACAFTDMDLRGKLRNPIFWLKMFFNVG
ncbi:MAG: geranylgeranyl reductase, partial [Bacteroidota bacterium]